MCCCEIVITTVPVHRSNPAPRTANRSMSIIPLVSLSLILTISWFLYISVIEFSRHSFPESLLGQHRTLPPATPTLSVQKSIFACSAASNAKRMGQEVSTQEDWDRPRFGTPERHKVRCACCRCLFVRLRFRLFENWSVCSPEYANGCSCGWKRRMNEWLQWRVVTAWLRFSS